MIAEMRRSVVVVAYEMGASGVVVTVAVADGVVGLLAEVDVSTLGCCDEEEKKQRVEGWTTPYWKRAEECLRLFEEY